MDTVEKRIHVAILGAVREEVEPLFSLFSPSDPVLFHGETFIIGSLGDYAFLFGTTGLGKVNAAITTAALLEHFSILQIWNIGCSGAYGDGPLRVGDVLLSTKVFCGDEGILTGGGMLSPKEIGIPLLSHDGKELYDHIPLDRQRFLRAVQDRIPEGHYRPAGDLSRAIPMPLLSKNDVMEKTPVSHHPAVRDLAFSKSCASLHPCSHDSEGAFRIVHGPSLTVSMTSGDFEIARKRFAYYGALAESMEGSAVAQTCFRFCTPVIECRGVSNMAGDRNKDHWEMDKAIGHCHGVVLHLLGNLYSGGKA